MQLRALGDLPEGLESRVGLGQGLWGPHLFLLPIWLLVRVLSLEPLAVGPPSPENSTFPLGLWVSNSRAMFELSALTSHHETPQNPPQRLLSFRQLPLTSYWVQKPGRGSPLLLRAEPWGWLSITESRGHSAQPLHIQVGKLRFRGAC